MANKNDTSPYVVMATAFGHKDQQISAALDKEGAEALAEKLKDAMDSIDGDFKVFENIKVVKYEPESLYPDKMKDDPYDYSILDTLDKTISKNN